MDKTDIKILEHLERYGMDSVKELSDELNISNSTIYYRIDRLKEDGVISGITADINPEKLGFDIRLVTKVFVIREPVNNKNIGKKLIKLEGVQEVFYTLGEVDFLVFSRAQDRKQVNQLIQQIVQIDGVNETSSIFVMDELSESNALVPSLSEDMIENIV